MVLDFTPLTYEPLFQYSNLKTKIPGEGLTKFHNSRTSNDIDKEPGPVTKLDKKNKTTMKKFDIDLMAASCYVTVILMICSQSGAIWNLDSGHIVCKTYFFINSHLLP